MAVARGQFPYVLMTLDHRKVSQSDVVNESQIIRRMYTAYQLLLTKFR